MRSGWIVLLVLGATAASAQRAPFSIAESGRSFGHLQQAVDAIGGSAGTIQIAPGVYRECAVQTSGAVTFRAATPGTAVFERVACEGKAALVLRGRGTRVEGLVFRGYAVADHNGAGIRIEQGDLVVTNSVFRDSELGIIGGARVPGGPRWVKQRVTIERSTFTGLGRCRPDNCSHAIYLWTGIATITHSRFEQGRGGHYVKLRTPVVAITANSFDDGGGIDTSRMIDLSEGATGTIAGNLFVQGPRKDNAREMIAVRPEFLTYRSAGLRVTRNVVRLAAGATPPVFVMDWSGERLAVGGNRLAAGVRDTARR